MKPSFFQNEQLAELPYEARLLFVGLWCLADREGRLEDRPKRIKMHVFPGDTLDVDPLLDGLADQGLIVRYEVDGIRCIEIPNFLKHQRPHVNEHPSALPKFHGEPKAPTKVASTCDQGSKHSALNPSSLNPESCFLNPREDPSAAARPAKLVEPEYAEFRATYPKRNGNQPWNRARRCITARLSEGHTWAELLDGARRYAEWCRVTGKIDTEHVMQAATFCGPDKAFLKPWTPPATKADVRLAGNLDAAAEFMRRTEVLQ